MAGGPSPRLPPALALRTGRRFIGIELKPEYAATAIKNLRRAEDLVHGQTEMALEIGG